MIITTFFSNSALKDGGRAFQILPLPVMVLGIVNVIFPVTLKADRVVVLLFGIFHKISLFFIEHRFHTAPPRRESLT